MTRLVAVLVVGFAATAAVAQTSDDEMPSPEAIGEQQKAIEVPPVPATPPPEAMSRSIPSASDGSYETVVSTSRSEERLFEVERSVDVVDGKTIDRQQARSLPEALQETTGVLVQQTNIGAGAPIIRGLVGPQNLIVVDGVRFNTATFRTGPNQYLATIDPLVVRRIEVLRGPSSVLYGSGAMGGVLYVITKDPDARRRSGGSAGGRLTSADLGRTGWLQLRQRHGALGYVAGGSAAGFSTLRSGGGRRWPQSGYQRGSWHAKAVVGKPHSTGRLTAAYFGSVLRNVGRTDQLGRGDMRNYDNDDHLGYMALRYRGKGMLRRFDANVSFHRLVEVIERSTCGTGSDGSVLDLRACARLSPSAVVRRRRNVDAVNAIGFESSAQLKFIDDLLRVSVGGEAYRDSVSSRASQANATSQWEPRSRGNFSDGSTYRTLGLFAHANAQLLDFNHLGKLRLTAGTRLSHFAAHADAVPGVGEIDYSSTRLIGSGGIQLVNPELFNVYATFVQGFRAPNLQETTVLGDTGSKFEVPNGDLKPERSDTVEVGGRLRWGPLEASAAVFRSMLRDTIDEADAIWEGDTEVDGKPVVQRVNAEGGTIDGVEGSLRVRVSRYISAAAGAAWLRGEIDPSDPDAASHAARRIPPLIGTGSLRVAPPSGDAYGEIVVQWAGRQSRLHPSDSSDLRICETERFSGQLLAECEGTPGWITVGLRAGWRFNSRLRIDVAVMNLTDERYRFHGSGVDAPGIDGRVTLSFDL